MNFLQMNFDTLLEPPRELSSRAQRINICVRAKEEMNFLCIFAWLFVSCLHETFFCSPYKKISDVK